jgi:hypothetical protein
MGEERGQELVGRSTSPVHGTAEAVVRLGLAGARDLDDEERLSLARVLDRQARRLGTLGLDEELARLARLWAWYEVLPLRGGEHTVCLLGAEGEREVWLGAAKRHARDKSAPATGRHVALRRAFAQMVGYRLRGSEGLERHHPDAVAVEPPTWMGLETAPPATHHGRADEGVEAVEVAFGQLAEGLVDQCLHAAAGQLVARYVNAAAAHAALLVARSGLPPNRPGCVHGEVGLECDLDCWPPHEWPDDWTVEAAVVDCDG